MCSFRFQFTTKQKSYIVVSLENERRPTENGYHAGLILLTIVTFGDCYH